MDGGWWWYKALFSLFLSLILSLSPSLSLQISPKTISSRRGRHPGRRGHAGPVGVRARLGRVGLRGGHQLPELAQALAPAGEDLRPELRPRPLDVVADELAQRGRAGARADALHRHDLSVDLVRQRAVGVVEVGEASRHARGDVASGGAQADDGAA